MKRNILIKITILVIALFSLNISTYAAKVTILHTNDSHSNLVSGGPRTENLEGTIGGIARFATLIGMTKMEDAESLVLHSGDFSIGDIMFCKYLGAAELQLMSNIGVDAITLGNHEFDLTPLYLDSVLIWGKLNPDMKILCANGNFEAFPPLQNKIIPDTTFFRNGVKIGVFGMTTPETMIISQPSPVSFSMDENEIAGIVGAEVEKLRTAGCQIVIMLSHMGYANDCGLAKIPGIDAIIGGHDHFLFDTPTEISNIAGGKCYVTQVGSFYEYAGKFVFDVSENGVQLDSWNLIPLDEKIPEAEEIKTFLDGMKAEVEETYGSIAPVYSTKIAEATETFIEFGIDLKSDGYVDNQVGNLVADAFRAWGKTDIGLTASGMTSHPLYKGPIVAADIYRMIGYGFNTVNTLGYRMVKFEMKGEDILKGIQFGLLNISVTDDYLLVFSNLFYEYKFIKQEGHPLYQRGLLIPTSVKVGGQPIELDKWYTITTQEGILAFLYLLKSGAFGAEFTVDFRNLVQEEQLTEYMVLLAYLTQIKTAVPSTMNRILSVIDALANYDLEKSDKIYPNPCMDKVSFDIKIEKPGDYSIQIFNQDGSLAANLGTESLIEGTQTKTISTRNLRSGIYTYIITNDNQKIIGRFAVVK